MKDKKYFNELKYKITILFLLLNKYKMKCI